MNDVDALFLFNETVRFQPNILQFPKVCSRFFEILLVYRSSDEKTWAPLPPQP